MDQFRTFLIIIASFLFLPAEAANGQDTKDIKYINDSLLHVLDKAIADSKALREQREERISTLQATYNSASSWSVRYDIAQQLYQLTRTYKTVTRQTSANASSWSNTSGRGSSGRPCSP